MSQEVMDVSTETVDEIVARLGGVMGYDLAWTRRGNILDLWNEKETGPRRFPHRLAVMIIQEESPILHEVKGRPFLYMDLMDQILLRHFLLS